ncbi:hypothetical protein FE257_008829 [Aspergillus nanangensis]|uniref:Uncharacterized protein n=1 Tax=Aspergillus nanangensis TaxID=2582783 RepID=A0AAD4CKL5_ASPNN|nr:hypothetical protein FE257_008829 [Aspergillus nanangensis]
MRVQNLFTVAALLAIVALAFPTSKPNDNPRGIKNAMRREENVFEAGAASFAADAMRHKREEAISADQSDNGGLNKREGDVFQVPAQPNRLRYAKRDDQADADKSYEGIRGLNIGNRKRAETDSPDKTIPDSPDKTIKDAPDSSDTSKPDPSAKGKGTPKDTPNTPKREEKATADKSYEALGLKQRELEPTDKSI